MMKNSKKNHLLSKVLIIGFTCLCEGKLYIANYGSNGFTCTKRIPVVKAASGTRGKIEYLPMDEIKYLKDVSFGEKI